MDQRAVDTVRVLAMDAVERVGNGHPGTAMSLAPAAYLLFQRLMRHDPADPQWLGRDRFVLSAGHSSLTLYIQLYLAGYGLELAGPRGVAHLGFQDPGSPGVQAIPRASRRPPGRSGQGVGNAVGMAMASRRERGLLDPDAPAGQSPFDHMIWCIASDGDMEEGVSSEASSLAGTQELGNLVVIWDHNKISIEDDTNVAFTEDVARRYEAYGWHVQKVEWAHEDGYVEDVAALHEPCWRRRPRRPGRRSSRSGRSSRGPPRTRRTPARPTARRSAPTRSPRPSRSSASTPSSRFMSTRRCWPTPVACKSAARLSGRVGGALRRLAAGQH